MFNERMKEEALRRDVCREAEEACLKTMRDHLAEFLQTQNNEGTYEEWIFALHPENTQDASLLQDMEYKEVDLRFYVEESDHRILWNETVNDPHRQVAARTRMWSSSQNNGQQEQIVDLLGSDIQQHSPPVQDDAVSSPPFDPFGDDVRPASTEGLSSNTTVPVPKSTGSQQEVDLLSF
jgi:hypothetical protein